MSARQFQEILLPQLLLLLFICPTRQSPVVIAVCATTCASINQLGGTGTGLGLTRYRTTRDKLLRCFASGRAVKNAAGEMMMIFPAHKLMVNKLQEIYVVAGVSGRDIFSFKTPTSKSISNIRRLTLLLPRPLWPFTQFMGPLREMDGELWPCGSSALLQWQWQELCRRQDAR